MHEENHEDKGGCEDCECSCGGSMKKEFKLAMIEKKEKMLKAELEFIGQLKEIIKKMPDSKE